MIITVFGRKKQGKSTLSAFLARRIRSRVGAYPVLIFDPTGVYENAFSCADEEELSMAMEKENSQEFLAYQPHLNILDPEFNHQTVGEFIAFIETIGLGEYVRSNTSSSRPLAHPVVLIIDECSYLLRAKILDGIIRASKMDKLFLILSTHRPPDFPTLLRSQIDELFLFRAFLPSDLQTIEDMCGKEASMTVANLPNHHVFRYVVSTNESETWSDPSSWYIPISQGAKADAS